MIKSTTIIGIRKANLVVVAGDGQASFGNTVMKANVKKIRRLGQDNSVISGFAGSTADAFALFERLEGKLDQYKNQLTRFSRLVIDLGNCRRTGNRVTNPQCPRPSHSAARPHSPRKVDGWEETAPFCVAIGPNFRGLGTGREIDPVSCWWHQITGLRTQLIAIQGGCQAG